ncbi:MAG TPA: 3'(2'),5'-bisphosphate nucleotidase CysQ [Chitinophagales bacterium]
MENIFAGIYQKNGVVSFIEKIREIAEKAGEAIIQIYAQDISVEYKSDKSPVTLADQNANEIIVSSLQKHFPEIPIISEESPIVDFSERQNWQRLWLIDPLDGTKEFIKKNGEFTVNIALIENGEPIFGLIYAPALKEMYYGEKNVGSFKLVNGAWQKIERKKHYSEKGVVVVATSRSHQSYEVNTFIKRLLRNNVKVSTCEIGSSLKLCLVAESTADVYPRFGDTMEWDIAAGHAIITFAGGNVFEMGTKNPLRYNKESLKNPHFIAE